MGSVRKGRACRAVMRVARAMGGRGDPGVCVSWGCLLLMGGEEEGEGRGETYCPMPGRTRLQRFWHSGKLCLEMAYLLVFGELSYVGRFEVFCLSWICLLVYVGK